VRRGDIYLTRLDPVEGSEQSGTRPVVIVSRNSLNDSTSRVTIVSFTTYRGRPVGPHQALVSAAPDGLRVDSVALCEQVRSVSKTRLLRRWGAISPDAMAAIDRALAISLALDGSR
jgi:mRNA interferase MazF